MLAMWIYNFNYAWQPWTKVGCLTQEDKTPFLEPSSSWALGGHEMATNLQE
jgi:hypothetical protein